VGHELRRLGRAQLRAVGRVRQNAHVAVSPSVRPIRLVVRDDDLRRSRLTVFFRLFLAIPLFIWLLLWGIAAYVVAFVLWLAVLINAEAPRGLHDDVLAGAPHAHVSAEPLPHGAVVRGEAD